MAKKDVVELIEAERRVFRAARQSGNRALAWTALEREHILGQGFFGPHLRSHMTMLGYAVETRDGREIWGQVIRLALAPLGNLTGRANVSAFAPMPYPDDLAEILTISSDEAR